MPQEKLPDFIHAGTTKAGSSWLYKCLSEHPETGLAVKDDLNFFNINYHRGVDWYLTHFESEGQVVGEVSPGYLQHMWTAERIADTIPDVMITFCLRNPVDRAYSHWWHSYSNKYMTYDFEQIFENYPPYHHWVVPGFYEHHLSRFYEHFSEDRIKVFLFDDLVKDNNEFIEEFYSYIGVDPSFNPSLLGTKDNTADSTGEYRYVLLRNWVRKNAPDTLERLLKLFWDPVRGVVESRDEYEEGMSEDTRRQLERIYIEDARRLSERIERDLSDWFEYEDL